MSAIAECPICSSTNVETLYPSFSGTCITSDMTVLRESSLDNRLCGGCGLIFNAGGTRGKTDSFYRNSYSLMMQRPSAAIQNFSGSAPISQAERSYQILREMAGLPPKGRVLEVGAGKGEFLGHFAAAMKDWHITASEPSAAFDILRERFPSIETQRGDYRDAQCKNGSLNLIVALGVLEHVENPLDMLVWASQLLRPGGCFFIRVPNFSNNPNDLFCADHLSKLTVPTLRALAANSGFEVLGVKEAGVPVFIALRKSDRPGEALSVVRREQSDR